jgi:hypothetical protein
MSSINDILEGKSTRREVGAATLALLAGCSTNDSENSSTPADTSTPTSAPDTDSATSSETTGGGQSTQTGDGTESPSQEEEGIPEAEDGDLESRAEANVAERGDFGLKVGNYDAVDLPEYPDVELGRNDEGEFYTLEEALYLAMNVEDDGRPSETVYIMGKNLGSDSVLKNGGMQMYVNDFSEDGSGVRIAAQIEDVVYGDLAEGEVTDEKHREAYSSFFEDHIDIDAIVDSCGDVPDYVENAL